MTVHYRHIGHLRITNKKLMIIQEKLSNNYHPNTNSLKHDHTFSDV